MCRLIEVDLAGAFGVSWLGAGRGDGISGTSPAVAPKSQLAVSFSPASYHQRRREISVLFFFVIGNLFLARRWGVGGRNTCSVRWLDSAFPGQVHEWMQEGTYTHMHLPFCLRPDATLCCSPVQAITSRSYWHYACIFCLRKLRILSIN
jgi:hypothetical protein